MVTICETLATESFGRPETRAGAGGKGEVGPPYLPLKDHHCDRRKVRREAADTKGSR